MHMSPLPSKGKTAFRLPPDVSFEKQRLYDAWAYVFRHRVLGELGRILLQESGDGRCHISCEVVGDPSDPMTAQRIAIFQPLGLELTRQMEMAMGTTTYLWGHRRICSKLYAKRHPGILSAGCGAAGTLP
jgi:hypothetical protein